MELKKKNLREVEEDTIDMKFFDDMKHVLFCQVCSDVYVDPLNVK